MMDSPIKLRVKRDEFETIVIWNTNVLTPEQQMQPNIAVQLMGSSGWFTPQLTTPDLRTKMSTAIDGPTDARSIKHEGQLDGNATFRLRLSFGPKLDYETFLDVKPKGEHTGHVKVVRVKKSSGKAIYAQPSFLVGLDDDAKASIAQIVGNVVRQELKQQRR